MAVRAPRCHVVPNNAVHFELPTNVFQNYAVMTQYGFMVHTDFPFGHPLNLHLCQTFISLLYFASYAFVRHILTFLSHILAHVAKTAAYTPSYRPIYPLAKQYIRL